jgi:hypothetical protein
MKIPAQLIELAREYCAEMANGPTLMDMRRELRQCVATTKRGKRCRCFALWDAEGQQLCVNHYRGPKIERSRPGKRNGPTCDCPAYSFPHRPGTGYCRWPDEPVRRHDLQAGTHRPGKLRRRKIRSVMRKFGMLKGGTP